MLKVDVAKAIAFSFVSRYYELFTTPRAYTTAIEFYGENSFVSFATVKDENPTIYSSKKEINLHLQSYDDFLSVRKVQVRHVDVVPLPEGSINVLCEGSLYLPGQIQTFIQNFVLSRNSRRVNTYYVSADILRYTSVTIEDIPENYISVTPEQLFEIERIEREEEERRLREEEERRQQRELEIFRQEAKRRQEEEAARARAEAVAVAEAEAVAATLEAQRRAREKATHQHSQPADRRAGPSEYRREDNEYTRGRGRGRARGRGYGGDESSAPHYEGYARHEGRGGRGMGGRGRKDFAPQAAHDGSAPAPAAPVPAGAAAPSASREEGKSALPPRKNNSPSVIYYKVPKSIRLSEISKAAEECGCTVKDTKWVGHESSHCVVTVASTTESETLLRKPLSIESVLLKAFPGQTKGPDSRKPDTRKPFNRPPRPAAAPEAEAVPK